MPLLVLGIVVGQLLMPLQAAALAVPPAPKDIPVLDQTNTLSSEQKQALATKIAKERSATGNQVAVLMVKSLDGQAIEDYSLAVARGWSIGQKDRDSGVLLLVAKDDHKLRIEVGYGLEGALTDARSAQIIRNEITPEFKEGKFYEGLDKGVDGILKAIHGETDPNLSTEKQQASGWRRVPWELVFWGVIIIPVWLGSILARSKSWWAGGVVGGVGGVIVGLVFGFLFVGVIAIAVLIGAGLLFDRAVSANYLKHATKRGDGPPSWWAGGPWLGGGGHNSGNGGFGGFGGGGFGGGGAGGSW
jgi:uncharacterized protein